MLNAQQLVADGLDLVSLPEVYLQVKAVLDDPQSAAIDMAKAIETDPAVTARLLRIANSSFFGFAAEVSSVSRAVSMLGTLQVHDLVLASSLANTFNRVDDSVLDVADFWQSSVRRGVGSKVLASLCNLLDSERVFLAALLSRIGIMVLALREPLELQQSIADAEADGLPLSLAQHRRWGFDYAEVGARLLKAWQLPAALESVVRFHTRPELADEFLLETAIVSVAAALSEPGGWQLNAAALAQLPLDNEQLEHVPAQIEAQALEVLRLLFPVRRQAA